MMDLIWIDEIGQVAAVDFAAIEKRIGQLGLGFSSFGATNAPYELTTRFPPCAHTAMFWTPKQHETLSGPELQRKHAQERAKSILGPRRGKWA